ncbi:MAG: lanthionine synthetase C family protein [Pyrinomonadaceae bacterium]
MQTEMSRGSWRPILDGPLAERARTALNDIVGALPDPSAPETDNCSLAGGTAGLAILCAYLARAGFADDENAAQFLSQAIEAVSKEQIGPSLYGGFTGVAWAAAHLQEQLLDTVDDDVNGEIDEVLKDYLQQSSWSDDYDLIVGLVGFGVYALERLPRPAAVKCLERVIHHLDQTAERKPDGITWLTPPDLLPPHQRKECPEGYYNLGLAHGVPGVIAMLGQACAAGIASDKARPLLDGAVAWLLSQKLTDAESTFSSWAVPGVKSNSCRVAWCYGDAGLSAALLLAARSVGDSGWEDEAISIARRAAIRPAETAGVIDAGLCHGAAGLGHIYNRMFQATGDQLFKERARFWFERTLELRRPGKGIAGFSAYHPEEDGTGGWADDPGILMGAAGIALALLAATTDIAPEWDRMLLVSIPQRP